MLNQAKRIQNHIIVIGYGRVGRSVVEALRDGSEPMLLVERSVQAVQEATERGIIQPGATR